MINQGTIMLDPVLDALERVLRRGQLTIEELLRRSIHLLRLGLGLLVLLALRFLLFLLHDDELVVLGVGVLGVGSGLHGRLVSGNQLDL